MKQQKRYTHDEETQKK